MMVLSMSCPTDTHLLSSSSRCFFFWVKWAPMATALPGADELKTMNFMDFPEDVQLTILSFLSAADVSAFAATSRRSRSLCRPDSRLWYALSHRRWGRLTHIHRWGPAAGSSFRTLYRSLARCQHLVGFWRHIASRSSPLLFFGWGPSFIAGSRVFPSGDGAGYGVAKAPFLWMGVSPGGEPVNFLDPDQRLDFAKVGEKGVLGSPDLVPVHVNLVGRNHLVVEEDVDLDYEDGGGTQVVGSWTGDEEAPPGVAMAEVYQYFANRTSPGGDRALRKQRRKEKERLAKRRFEREHYVRVVDCSPTPSRPLQGLWKVLLLSLLHLLSHLPNLI